MRIFLLSGKARSGKGTTAEYLKEVYGDKCIELMFAKSIKQYAIDYFGWDGKENSKPRELLQNMGTEVIRDKLNNPNFHVKRVIEDIEILENYFESFIISDCRFPNEVSLIKERFGEDVISIRIERDFTNLTCDQQQHPSELALDNYKEWDHVLHNNSTIERLETHIDEVIGGLI